MSKAFVRDDDGAPEDDPLPARPGERLPVTPRGFARFEAELAALRQRGEGSSRRARLLSRVLDGVYVQPPALENGGVGFGCVVVFEVEESQEQREFEIVGPDEADAGAGRISCSSPVGKALLGARPGDTVVLKKPRGDEEVTLVSLRLGS